MSNIRENTRMRLKEWHTVNACHLKQAEEQCKLAERLRAEGCRIQENVKEVLHKNLEETNVRFEERILEEHYRKNEIELLQTQIQIEIEPLAEIRRRILAALKTLESCNYNITHKCCALREGRLGIDLVKDVVERELLQELKIIEDSVGIFRRCLDQVNEMERELRASLYRLNKDLTSKLAVLHIDQEARNLKETDVGLGIYNGKECLDPATISVEEWETFTNENLALATKRLNVSRPLRTYIDTVLKQVEQDLRNQDKTVSDAFRHRIEEVQMAKSKLEMQHFEVVRQANETERTLQRLAGAIVDKEKNLALAHTRLGNRAQRPSVELVRDEVELCLVKEVVDIKAVVAELRQALAQTEAVKRELLKTQVQLEEEINIKMNSLKIDEVDCMTLRQSIQHPSF